MLTWYGSNIAMRSPPTKDIAPGRSDGCYTAFKQTARSKRRQITALM